MKMKQKETNTYRSISEFHRKFFPHSYEEELMENRIKEPISFGTSLANDLLESIRKHLKK